MNDISPARFRRQLDVALELGYRFVPAEEIAVSGGSPGELAITFDDGLMSVATNAAPILADLRIPWTLFVVSGWAEGIHGWGDGVILGWREINRLAAQGAVIGSHSVRHPTFARLSTDAARQELFDSRDMIERRTGIRPRSFAIPVGRRADWTPEAGAAAREVGYEVIYAHAVSNRPVGTVPRTAIFAFDSDRFFRAALLGAFDQWQEWI